MAKDDVARNEKKFKIDRKRETKEGSSKSVKNRKK